MNAGGGSPENRAHFLFLAPLISLKAPSLMMIAFFRLVILNISVCPVKSSCRRRLTVAVGVFFADQNSNTRWTSGCLYSASPVITLRFGET